MKRILQGLLLPVLVLLGSGCAARTRSLPMEPMEWSIAHALAEHRQAQREELHDYLAATEDERKRLRKPFLRPDDIEDDGAKLKGLSDFHWHQFSALSWGQRVVHDGDAPCDGLDHGVRPGFTGWLLRFAPSLALDPAFSEMLPHCNTHDIPTHDSFAHNQHRPRDVENAWRGGMRLVFSFAVNGTILCALSQGYDRDTETSCRDHPNIDRQLEAHWTFAKEHDWYEIAVDPVDAYNAVREDKLSVVLGVEASDYFASARFRGGIINGDPHFEPHWRERHSAAMRARTDDEDRSTARVGGYTPGEGTAYSHPFKTVRRSDYVDAGAALDHIGVRGVQVAFLAHEWPSSMSASNIHNVTLFNPAYQIAKTFGYAERVSVTTLGLGFLKGLAGERLANWPIPVQLRKDRETGKQYPAAVGGLTSLGAAFLHHAEGTPLIFDVGHLSEDASRQMMLYYASRGKPQLIAHGHVPPRELDQRETRFFDYFAGRPLLQDLSRYGRSVLGYRTYYKPMRSALPLVDPRYLDPPEHRVRNCIWRADAPNECYMVGRDTSAVPFIAPGDAVSVYQVHLYLRQFGLPLGLGTDMNGFTFQPAPRLVARDASPWVPSRLVAGGMSPLDDDPLYDRPPPPDTIQRQEYAARPRGGMALSCLEPTSDPVTGQALRRARRCGDANRYARQGLPTVGESPQLAADLACLSRGHRDKDACHAAYGSQIRDVCGLKHEGHSALSDLCDGPRGFLERWAGFQIEPAAPTPIEWAPRQTATEALAALGMSMVRKWHSGALRAALRTAQAAQSPIPAPASLVVSASDLMSPAQPLGPSNDRYFEISHIALKQASDQPVRFSDVLFDSQEPEGRVILLKRSGESVDQSPVMVPVPSGGIADTQRYPRELLRNYIRELRRSRALGSTCQTANELVEEQQRKKDRRRRRGRRGGP